MSQKQRSNIGAVPTPQPSKGVPEAEVRTVPASAPVEEQGVQQSMQPHYPEWPTSKPGPRVKLPPPGMKSTFAFRPEQVAEIGYDQQAGTPSVASPLRSVPDDEVDQPTTAQDALGKRKKRL